MRTRQLAIGAALLLITVTLAVAQNGYDLFKDGLIKEQDGNLPEAIRIYERIVKDFEKSNRPLVAKTLVQLGGAYEKRKDTDRARAAYERVAQEFAVEGEAVEEARRRLAVLKGAAPNSELTQRVAVATADPASRTFDDLPVEEMSSVTPDGRFIVWADESGIRIRDLVARQTIQMMGISPENLEKSLTDPDDIVALIEASSRVTGAMGGLNQALLSPDLKWIVFVAHGRSSSELRVMPNRAGAEWRVLIANPEYRNLEAAGWSADRKSVLVTAERPDRTRLLAWVSIDKADTIKPLKSLGWRYNADTGGRGGGILGASAGRPSVSPDGAYVAYVAPPGDPGKPGAAGYDKAVAAIQNIYILRSDGSETEVAVAQGNNVNESPLWTPDGSRILFVSNRSGTGFGLYSVGVKDGKVTDAIAPVRTSLISGRIRPIAITDKGSLYYKPERSANTVGGSDVFVAPIDPASGKATGPVLRPVNNFAGRNSSPAWSPDGKSIAFMRNRPGFQANESVALVINDSASNGEREYAFTYIDRTVPPVWFHDGKSVLVRRRYNDGQLFKVDLATGEFRSVEAIAHTLLPAGWGQAVPSSDGKTLFVSVESVDRSGVGRLLSLALEGRGADAQPRTNPEVVRQARIVAFDLESGGQKPVWNSTATITLSRSLNLSAPDFHLSRDGRTLVLNDAGRLVVLGVDGTNAHEVLSEGMPEAFAWGHDGKGIFFLGPAEAPANAPPGQPGGFPTFPLMRVSVQGGPAQHTGTTIPWTSDFDISPNGSLVAFTQGTDTGDGIYVIDNLTSLWNTPGKAPARQ